MRTILIVSLACALSGCLSVRNANAEKHKGETADVAAKHGHKHGGGPDDAKAADAKSGDTKAGVKAGPPAQTEAVLIALRGGLEGDKAHHAYSGDVAAAPAVAVPQ